MQKSLFRNKFQNKGFTLVELIIVIAIIAILAVVITPTYLRYLERSRQAMDQNCVSEIAHAAEIAVLHDGKDILPDNRIVVETTGDLLYTTTGDLTKAVQKIVPPGSYTFKSKAYKTQASITIEINDGQAEWSAPSA